MKTCCSRSVLPSQAYPVSYLPYGYFSGGVRDALLGFNGEHLSESVGGYFLGLGHRIYNPVLMRFFSSDSLSPFSLGGLNAYAYCNCEPINYRDPNGRFRIGNFVFWRNTKQNVYRRVDSMRPPQLDEWISREVGTLEGNLILRRIGKNSKQALVSESVPRTGIGEADVSVINQILSIKKRIVSGEERLVNLEQWNGEISKIIRGIDKSVHQRSEAIRDFERYAGKKLSTNNAFIRDRNQ
jgi:RHS repeat-associated protein